MPRQSPHFSGYPEISVPVILQKEIYNQRVAELQQYQKQSKQLKKQWDEAETERKEQEQDPILQKLPESNGLCHGAASRRRDAGAVLAAGTGAEQGSFRIYVRAVRIIEKRYGSVSRELDSYEQQGKHVGQTEVRLELEEKPTDLSEQIQELEQKYELLSRTLELQKTARDRFLGRYLDHTEGKTAEYLAILEPAWKDSIEMDVNLKLPDPSAGTPCVIRNISALAGRTCFGWRNGLH